MQKEKGNSTFSFEISEIKGYNAHRFFQRINY